jgi:hypothetical protein
MTIKLTKSNTKPDCFTAVDGRFVVEAKRTDGGYIRGYLVTDTKTGVQRFGGDTRNTAKAHIERIVSAELPDEKFQEVKAEVKRCLHSCRDTMRILFHDRYLTDEQRNRLADPSKVRIDARLADYGQAYGLLSALCVLGYIQRSPSGGSSKVPNVQDLMYECENEVLAEEGFGHDGKCPQCFSKYGRDDARPR